MSPAGSLVLVAAGAALGAPTRFLIDQAVTRRWGSRLPWGTFVVNVIGSLLLGVVVVVFAGTGTLALGMGFCGAFTTYSAFAAQTWQLAETRRLCALLYAVVSVVASVLAFSAGLALTMQLVHIYP